MNLTRRATTTSYSAPQTAGPPPHWSEHAVCGDVNGGLDPDLWFAEELSAASDRAHAKQLCQSCAVRVECLKSALTRNERFGIWGGFTTDERDAARRTAVRLARGGGGPGGGQAQAA